MKWTTEEEQFLFENYSKMKTSDIAMHLGRTENSVKCYANRRGLVTGRYLTKSDEEYILKNYRKMSLKDIGEHIGKSKGCVRLFLNRNGLTKSKWTASEEDYLERKVGAVSWNTIAKTLNRSKASVICKAYAMGIGSAKDNLERISLTDVATLLGKERTVPFKWHKKGLIKSKKKNNYRTVTEEELVRFMIANPHLWDATKCETYFFSKYPWFQKRLYADRQKNHIERWNTDGKTTLHKRRTSATA